VHGAPANTHKLDSTDTGFRIFLAKCEMCSPQIAFARSKPSNSLHQAAVQWPDQCLLATVDLKADDVIYPGVERLADNLHLFPVIVSQPDGVLELARAGSSLKKCLARDSKEINVILSNLATEAGRHFQATELSHGW